MSETETDAATAAPWTIKGMLLESRRLVTAYAARHDVSVATAMAEAIGLLIERERGTELLPPKANGSDDLGKPDGIPPANLANRQPRRPQPTKLERLRDLAAIAKDLGDSEVNAGVARLAIAAINGEERRRKPPGRRTETPPLLTDRRQTWQENSHLVPIDGEGTKP